MLENDKRRGFISTIVLILIGLAILKYFFDINVIEILKQPPVSDVLTYLKKFILLVWTKFLLLPTQFVWDKIVVGIIWDFLKDAYVWMKGWVDSQ